MQPTKQPFLTSTRRVAVVSIVALLTLAGCGSSSSDSSGGSDTTAAAADTATVDPGTDTTPAPAVDLCATVTEADVAAALGDITLTGSEPVAGVDGSCQYFVDIGGMEAAVVQILSYPADYLEGQRELQTDATELSDIDGIAISSGAVLAATADGSVQVNAGVELTDGGSVATTDQLVAVAKLAGAQ